MKILALETSTLTGSVVLVDDSKVIAETTLSVSVQHSERLMPAIEELLKNSTTDISEIDLFAVSQGPGSFTGLRIGIAAAQGLALSQNKPIVGISTLEALAMNGFFFSGVIVPLLNAFRGDVYRGIYRMSSGLTNELVPLVEDQVVTSTRLAEELATYSEEKLLIGYEVPTLKNVTMQTPFFLNFPKASYVAALALNQWKKKPESHPIFPRYLREPG